MSPLTRDRLRLAWRERRLLVAAAVAVVVADQATKLAVTARLAEGEIHVLIPRFLAMTHSVNPGGVWGIGRDVPDAIRLVAFLLLPVVITVFAGWYALQLPAAARWRNLAVSLVVGGAVGNLVDRVRLRHVVDFVRISLGDFTWPDFNVADSAICIGVAVLIVSALFEREDEAPGDARAG